MIATEYCKNVFDGTHDSPKFLDKGYLLVTSKNIANRELDLTGANYISEDDYNKINERSKVHQWDIFFSMIGTVGNVYLQTEKEVNYAIKNMGVFSCENEDKAKWLYYYLQSPYFKKLMNSLLSGAVQKFVPLGFLRNIDIPKYDDNKKEIVKLLSSLDDKIALNNRINAKLEQMAKRLYDYWFVQFDFPGADGKPYKSNGGKMIWNEELKREISVGWEVKKLGDVTEIVLGGTPSTQETSFWNQGTINWLNSGEVGEFPIVTSEKKITEIAMQHSSTEFLKAGAVTLSITRYLRPSILAIDACINQSVVGLKENKLLKNCFMYPYLQNEVDRLMSLRTGAQQPHINKETVEESYIYVPTEEIMDEYNKRAQPIYNQIISVAKQNKKLSELRDKLLPLLMNGQVVVE